MGKWGLRLRAIVDDRYTVLVSGLVILVLLGGWISYTAVGTDTTTEQRTETVWETTGEFSHEATVVGNSSVFVEGRQLTDRPIYFTRISPRLSGSFRSTYAGTPRGNLSRRLSVSLLIRSVDQQQDGGENRVYWETSRPLNETTVKAVEPGEPVTVSFRYNMSALDSETARIREEFGATVGEIEVVVRATVDSRGTVRNTRINRTNNYTMAVDVTDATYSVGEDGPTTEQYETTRTETVESTAGPLRQFGGIGLLIGALLGLGGLVVGRRQGWVDLSEAERDRLAYRSHREEFDDWISTVELPAEAFELPQADADSLTALVDIAIDTNNTVIEDPDEDVFYLRHAGYLYSYRPPTTETESTTDTSTAPTDEAANTEDSPTPDE